MPDEPRAEQGDVRDRVRRRMAQEGIPVGSDNPKMQELGAPPLHKLCSTMGHEKIAAMGVVVLGDCEPEGSCEGHPYCTECMTELSADPYNTIVEDRRPETQEVPDIFYLEGDTAAAALRSLADRFDAEDDLVFIGLWNVEPPGGDPGATRLQVVVTHLTLEDTP